MKHSSKVTSLVNCASANRHVTREFRPQKFVVFLFVSFYFLSKHLRREDEDSRNEVLCLNSSLVLHQWSWTSNKSWLSMDMGLGLCFQVGFTDKAATLFCVFLHWGHQCTVNSLNITLIPLMIRERHLSASQKLLCAVRGQEGHCWPWG